MADAIEKELVRGREVGLDMRSWHGRNHACGTSACVAGFTELLFANEENGGSHGSSGRWFWRGSTRVESQKELELTGAQAEELFHASEYHVRLHGVDGPGYGTLDVNANSELVPDALRWMADNGVIDWSAGFHHACSIRKAKNHGSD